MRMWMLPSELLCRKHLLGGHNEIHKHRHNFVKQHSMKGRLYPIVQIEPASMKEEHDRLAEEMTRRGYNHKSPYEQPDVSYLGEMAYLKADIEYNIKDLATRCPECRKNILNSKYGDYLDG